jgi:transposase
MNDANFPGWQRERTIQVVESNGRTEVLVKGQRYMSWASGDEACLRLAIVQLHTCGLGSREDLAAAFGRHVHSVQRYLTDFAAAGLAGLRVERRGPKGPWKLTPALRGKILLIVLREGIGTLAAIQQRLAEAWQEEVSLPSIQEVLAENGLVAPPTPEASGGAVQGELLGREPERQLSLPLEPGGAPPRGSLGGKGGPEVAQSRAVGQVSGGEAGVNDMSKTYRRQYSPAQRVYLDQWEQGEYNAYAGGLLFAPLLERYQFLPTLRQVITIPTYEGYRLEELGLTLFYLDLFGFRSMEDFKRAYPEEFGLLVGRGQSPSLFTLRRFLHKVRKLGRGEALIEAFAAHYLRSGLAAWDVLYIDGHFVPYYGVTPISKGWHGVRQMPLKGSYHFLAVDEQFVPWLFLVRSASEDLLEKIPELIEQAKRIGAQAGVSQERLDQLIVVFDREGYSAELYRYLDGKDLGEGKRRALFISWAKYADKWVNDLPEADFRHVARVDDQIREPEEILYLETQRAMNKYGPIRAVVIQSGKDHRRSAIYTNGTAAELGAERVVQYLCRRWGEENTIKELLHKHLINYTPGYVSEVLEDQPLVDNPEFTELKRQRAGRMSELNRLKIELADQVLSPTAKQRKRPLRSRAEIEADITVAQAALLLLDQQLDPLAPEIPFDAAHAGQKLWQLNYEKKRFLDSIKVFAYNLNRQMCRLVLNHYDREKEVLPALAMMVDRTGYVQLHGGRLQVALRRFKDPEIDYAARHLCEDLNAMEPRTLDRFYLPIQYRVQ